MNARTRRTIAATAVVMALAVAPWTWLPALAGAAARRYLDFGQAGSAEIEITHLGPFRASVRGIRLGAIPGSPRVGSIEAKFTPWGLAMGRVSRIDASGAEWDLSTLVPAQASAMLPMSNATAKLALRWKDGRGYDGTLTADILGAPLEVAFSSDVALREFDFGARLDPAPGASSPLPPLTVSLEAWRPDSSQEPRPLLSADSGLDAKAALRAEIRAKFEGAPYGVEAEASLGDGNVALDAIVAPAAFDSSDALLGPIFAAFMPNDSPQPHCTGSVEARFTLSRPKDAPLPSWKAKARIRDGAVVADFGEKTASLAGCNALFRVDGIGAHADPSPFGVRFERAAFDKFALDSGSLWFRADAKSLLLTEGSAGLCGGTVRVYALHLDFSRLDAGFTLFLDDLDAGEVISLFPSVRGSATGKMHGKIPLSVHRGAEIRLHDAFLYSPPGQIGKLRLDGAAPLVDRLRETGVPMETCDSLEEALRDLDYDVLRLDLAQDRRSGAGRLALRLHGTAAASAGRAATPVDLNVSFNGQLEEMVNVGLQAAGIQSRGKHRDKEDSRR